MKFAQLVSMQCTEEQFNKDLKSELEKIGYKNVDYGPLSEDQSYLVTSNNSKFLANQSKGLFGQYFIEKYNPELFLALAAMTDKEDGNYGEYWKNILGKGGFNQNDLYKQYTNSLEQPMAFGYIGGYATEGKDANFKHFVKATKEEIINFFTKKETMIIVTIKKSDFKPLYDIACPEWKSKFNAFLIPFHFQDTIPFEEKFIEEMRKACTSSQIPVFESIFGKKKVEIDYDKLKTGSKVMIKYTGNHCSGINKIDTSKPVDIVFYKTIERINDDNVFYSSKGPHKSYVTFHQNGNYCLFASDNKIDYITEVIEY